MEGILANFSERNLEDFVWLITREYELKLLKILCENNSKVILSLNLRYLLRKIPIGTECTITLHDLLKKRLRSPVLVESKFSQIRPTIASVFY